MVDKLENIDSKEAYADIMIDAQKKQITVLNKKINELKVENEELRVKLKQAQATPSIMSGTRMSGNKEGLSDEEQVCKLEIAKLLEVSGDRELTLEESKKLDIYTKILNSKKTEEKKQVEPVNLSDTELLQFLKSGNS